MRGPKVVQHEIDKLEKGDRLVNKLHFMYVRLLKIDARDAYKQISEYRTRVWMKKNKLIREKKRAARLKK